MSQQITQHETEYFPHHLPNVKLEAASHGTSPQPVLHPMLEALVPKLATKHPEWDFVASANDVVWLTPQHYKSIGVFTRVTGTTPHKKVGEVRIERRYTSRGSEECYSIRSPRISKVRERGDAVMTTKTEVAAKTVNKMFTPPPISERIEEVQSRAYDLLHRAQRSVAYTHHEVESSLLPFIRKFAETQREQFIAWLPNEEARKLATDCDGIRNTVNKLNDMQNSWGGMLTVLIVDDKYIVRPMKDGGEVQVYANHELSDHLKKCIGMLKLVDNGELLPEIGVRVGNGQFVVTSN